MARPVVLVFGLDGATWKLINPWLKKGKLPFLKQLIKNGARGVLTSTLPPLTSTAWVSFQTGVNPSTHGIFGFQKENGRFYNSSDISQPTFWNLAGKHGKRCAIINMPLTYPLKSINGCLVSSFLTPTNANFAYPPELQKELLNLSYQIDITYNNNQLGFAEEKKLTKKQKEKLFKEIIALVNSRKRAASHIINKEPWDTLFVLFKATDIVQHFFWKQKETLCVYQKIDQAIKELVGQYRKKYPQRKINVFIISDHGFHPTAKKDICFYPLLTKLDIISRAPRWQLKLLRAVRKITKIKAVEKLACSKEIRITDYGIYWKTANKARIRSLVKKLSSLKSQGKKIFSEVKVNKSPSRTAPKILWLTNPYFAPNADPLSEKIFYPKKTFLKAHHHSDRKGIFIAAGPNIKIKTSKLDITDISTRILKVLGVKHNFKTQSPSPLKKIKAKKSDQEVINRLKALGYVD